MKPYYKIEKDILPEDFDFQEDLKVGNLQINENKNMSYSLGKGLWKTLLAVILFAVPVFLTSFPSWANLTVGGVLVLLLNFVKVRYNLIK